MLFPDPCFKIHRRFGLRPSTHGKNLYIRYTLRSCRSVGDGARGPGQSSCGRSKCVLKAFLLTSWPNRGTFRHEIAFILPRCLRQLEVVDASLTHSYFKERVGELCQPLQLAMYLVKLLYAEGLETLSKLWCLKSTAPKQLWNFVVLCVQFVPQVIFVFETCISGKMRIVA